MPAERQQRHARPPAIRICAVPRSRSSRAWRLARDAGSKIKPTLGQSNLRPATSARYGVAVSQTSLAALCAWEVSAAGVASTSISRLVTKMVRCGPPCGSAPRSGATHAARWMRLWLTPSSLAPRCEGIPILFPRPSATVRKPCCSRSKRSHRPGCHGRECCTSRSSTTGRIPSGSSSPISLRMPRW